MQQVALACDFSLAEALQPRDDGRCLVQSGVSWERNEQVGLFHKCSSDLIFPPNVGIPGRCWKLRRMQMHADVTALPPTIFLRAEMAEKAGLKGCVAIPLQVEGASNFFFVTLYFAPFDLYDPELVRQISDKTVEVTQQMLQQAGSGCAVSIPVPLSAEVLNQATPPMWLSQSRTWLRCEIALSKAPAQRSADDLEDIVKFTRKLDFFKNMSEAPREELCRSMLLISQTPGVIISRSSDPDGPQPWYIAIQGRLAVMTSDAGGTCPVWFFESGQTFARSYLHLFGSRRPSASDQASAGGQSSLMSHIETLSSVKYLQVHVPERLQGDFRVWTRPLWYEELAHYFHVGINEAAEALGPGPS